MLLSTGIDLNHTTALPVNIMDYPLVFVWHKATQGSTFVDPRFVGRRQWCNELNIPFAGYHFADASDPDVQAANFFKVLGEKPVTMALDWEDLPDNTMTYANAVRFLNLLLTRQEEIGGDVYVYGSDRITENIAQLSTEPTLKKVKVWLARPIHGNGPLPIDYQLPKGVAVLQYSADGPGYCKPPYAELFDGADWNLVDPATIKSWP